MDPCTLYHSPSSIVAAFIQKKLYHFLQYSFKHSPLDNNFRYVRSVWCIHCITLLPILSPYWIADSVDDVIIKGTYLLL